MKKTLHKTPHIYRPPKWAPLYLAAMLDPDTKPSVAARCEFAGIDRGTFYDALKRPKFVEWLDREFEAATKSEIGEVRKALVKMCLKENLEAVRLYLERYDHGKPAGPIDEDFATASNKKLSDIAREMEETADGTGPSVH